jgi:hypothetical protein
LFAKTRAAEGTDQYGSAKQQEILSLANLANEGLERYGGNPTSHTPAHNVPAVAASFRI